MNENNQTCKNCEYWFEKYYECEHPDAQQVLYLVDGAQPDTSCELWESKEGEQE